MLIVPILNILLAISNVADCMENEPKVEQSQLKRLYLPASIQILSHINDNLRPNLRPMLETILSPTSTHMPGIFSPFSAKALFENEFKENMNEINFTDIGNEQNNSNIPSISTPLFGKFFHNFIKLVHENHQISNLNEFEEVLAFLKVFDDNDVQEHFLRENRKNGIVRAYITFIYIYDNLSKEGKRKNLQKFQGYTYDLLYELEELSKLECKDQLKIVLERMLNSSEVNSEALVQRVQNLINDLNDNKGYITLALQNIPPLKFLP